MMDTYLRKQNEGVRGSAEKATMNPCNGDTKDIVPGHPQMEIPYDDFSLSIMGHTLSDMRGIH